jgi:hypothetical protein
VLHQTGVQKDLMTLYHLQNGHSVLMYDHSSMEQQVTEQMEHLTVLKTLCGQHYLEQDYQMQLKIQQVQEYS